MIITRHVTLVFSYFLLPSYFSLSRTTDLIALGSSPLNHRRVFELRAGWDIQEDDEKKPCLDPPQHSVSGHTRISPEGCDSESNDKKPDINDLPNNNDLTSTSIQMCTDSSTKTNETLHVDATQSDLVADTMTC